METIISATAKVMDWTTAGRPQTEAAVFPTLVPKLIAWMLRASTCAKALPLARLRHFLPSRPHPIACLHSYWRRTIRIRLMLPLRARLSHCSAFTTSRSETDLRGQDSPTLCPLGTLNALTVAPAARSLGSIGNQRGPLRRLALTKLASSFAPRHRSPPSLWLW